MTTTIEKISFSSKLDSGVLAGFCLRGLKTEFLASSCSRDFEQFYMLVNLVLSDTSGNEVFANSISTAIITSRPWNQLTGGYAQCRAAVARRRSPAAIVAGVSSNHLFAKAAASLELEGGAGTATRAGRIVCDSDRYTGTGR
jgi:hypothetical protein